MTGSSGHRNQDMNGYFVMVVDDDPHARKLLVEMLETAGLPFAEAENGFAALKQIFVRTPALILLDLMMPKMDGFQVIAQLKGNLATCHILIIVMTGMDDGWESLTLPSIERVILTKSSILSLRSERSS